MSEDVYTRAARAFYLDRYSYDGAYADDDARKRHIQSDADDVSAQPWLRAIVDTATTAERNRITDALALHFGNQVRAAIGEPVLRAQGEACTCVWTKPQPSHNGLGEPRFTCPDDTCNCLGDSPAPQGMTRMTGRNPSCPQHGWAT